ncbi:hypothetical protein GQ55_1G207100 [Panicum hallii var. hallii]|uniref:Uncharacterized protein n=1 Tax=Panicum hallii var. hallii TaxID=1504633 RepID=A0A2T7F6E7_9POAL|nr:hypothetical protein GQ55_1G207100 [Panicum hallii var. hallii]
MEDVANVMSCVLDSLIVDDFLWYAPRCSASSRAPVPLVPPFHYIYTAGVPIDALWLQQGRPRSATTLSRLGLMLTQVPWSQCPDVGNSGET